MHLDATYADLNIRREFAICFLKLSQQEEDRMSACPNGNEVEHEQQFSIRFDKTPRIFTDGQSRKSWKVRCGWWFMQHFSHRILE